MLKLRNIILWVKCYVMYQQPLPNKHCELFICGNYSTAKNNNKAVVPKAYTNLHKGTKHQHICIYSVCICLYYCLDIICSRFITSDGVEYSTFEYEYCKKLLVQVLILKNVLEYEYHKKVRVRVLLQVCKRSSLVVTVQNLSWKHKQMRFFLWVGC